MCIWQRCKLIFMQYASSHHAWVHGIMRAWKAWKLQLHITSILLSRELTVLVLSRELTQGADVLSRVHSPPRKAGRATVANAAHCSCEVMLQQRRGALIVEARPSRPRVLQDVPVAAAVGPAELVSPAGDA